MKQKPPRVVLALFAVCGPLCWGADPMPSEKTAVDRWRWSVGVEFSSMAAATSSLSGIGLNGGIQAGLTSSVGVGAAVRQSVSTLNSVSSYFSEVDFFLGYAVFGSYQRNRTSVQLGSAPVYEATSTSGGGLFLQAHISQYFFYGSVTIPASGLGASLSYELPSSTNWNYQLSVRMDQASSSARVFYPIQFRLAVAFWL